MSDFEHLARLEAGIASERLAIETFRLFLEENREVLRPVAHWGDGRGGYLCSLLIAEFFGEAAPVGRGDGKAKISRALAKQVFERDAYRCVSCSGYHDLTCDHVVPESVGGPTTLENLQTMCRSCNSRKGTAMPEATP